MCNSIVVCDRLLPYCIWCDRDRTAEFVCLWAVLRANVWAVEGWDHMLLTWRGHLKAVLYSARDVDGMGSYWLPFVMVWMCDHKKAMCKGLVVWYCFVCVTADKNGAWLTLHWTWYINGEVLFVWVCICSCEEWLVIPLTRWGECLRGLLDKGRWLCGTCICLCVLHGHLRWNRINISSYGWQRIVG